MLKISQALAGETWKSMKYEILLPSFFRLPGFTVGGSPREMERDGRQKKKRRNVGGTVERNGK